MIRGLLVRALSSGLAIGATAAGVAVANDTLLVDNTGRVLPPVEVPAPVAGSPADPGAPVTVTTTAAGLPSSPATPSGTGPVATTALPGDLGTLDGSAPTEPSATADLPPGGDDQSHSAPSSTHGGHGPSVPPPGSGSGGHGADENSDDESSDDDEVDEDEVDEDGPEVDEDGPEVGDSADEDTVDAGRPGKGGKDRGKARGHDDDD